MSTPSPGPDPNGPAQPQTSPQSVPQPQPPPPQSDAQSPVHFTPPVTPTSYVVCSQPPLVPVMPGELVSYGDQPLTIVCQYCRATVETSTEFREGALTYCLCLGMLLFGLYCGCCLLPFCIDSTKDIYHTCPNCHGVVGRKSRMC